MAAKGRRARIFSASMELTTGLAARRRALLEVEEGESHGDYLLGATAGAPESFALYSHVAEFFDAHLGR